MTEVEIHALTAGRWGDLEQLFGPRGAVGGCWCMWFRETAAEFVRNKGDANRLLLKSAVDDARPVGLVAYLDGEPAGWCSVSPRADYVRLAKSRILKQVDEQPVWSVVCFFIGRKYRRAGVGSALLRAAADFAREHGAQILEGYPVEPRQSTMPDAFAFTGTVSMFRAAGFDEVARRSPGRPVMRKALS